MARQLITAAQTGDLAGVTRLIEGGEEGVDDTDDEQRKGTTALHYAADRNQQAIVEYLLDKGASVNHQDISGQSPLHRAAVRGSVSICKLLLAKGAHIDRCDRKGSTALWYACYHGHDGAMTYFKNEGADIAKPGNGRLLPLHIACQQGHVHIVSYLLSQGVDVDTRMCDGRTPLHVAAGTGNGGGHLQVVKVLLERGADIGKVNSGGWTVLHCACHTNNVELIEYLVIMGADVNLAKNDGGAPLRIAAANGKLSAVKCLTSKGAMVDHQDNFGNTGLHKASEKGHVHIVEFLLQDSEKRYCMINKTNENGRTPMHLATEFGHTLVIDVLLSYGADINFRAAEGQTCLHLAAELCNKPESKVEMTPNVSKIALLLPSLICQEAQALFVYIVKRGAVLTNMDTRGKTPLDCIIDLAMRESIQRHIALGSGSDIGHDAKSELKGEDTAVDGPNSALSIINISGDVGHLSEGNCAEPDTNNGTRGTPRLKSDGNISSGHPQRTPPTPPLADPGKPLLTEHILFELSNQIPLHKVEPLGFKLGFTYAEIFKYKSTNSRGPLVSSEGTNAMLQEWYQRTPSSQSVINLRDAVIEAGLTRLADFFLE